MATPILELREVYAFKNMIWTLQILNLGKKDSIELSQKPPTSPQSLRDRLLWIYNKNLCYSQCKLEINNEGDTKGLLNCLPHSLSTPLLHFASVLFFLIMLFDLEYQVDGSWVPCIP